MTEGQIVEGEKSYPKTQLPDIRHFRESFTMLDLGYDTKGKLDTIYLWWKGAAKKEDYFQRLEKAISSESLPLLEKNEAK